MAAAAFSHRAAVAFQERTGMHPSEASGLRKLAYARSTGTLVGVYHSADAGLEDDPDPSCRWATVCEDHGRLVLHPTLLLAERHSSAPEGWCGICNGSESEDDQ